MQKHMGASGSKLRPAVSITWVDGTGSSGMSNVKIHRAKYYRGERYTRKNSRDVKMSPIRLQLSTYEYRHMEITWGQGKNHLKEAKETIPQLT